MQKLSINLTKEELQQIAIQEGKKLENRLNKMITGGAAFILGGIWSMMWLSIFDWGDVSMMVIVGSWALIGTVIISHSAKTYKLKRGDITDKTVVDNLTNSNHNGTNCNNTNRSKDNNSSRGI